MKTIYLLRHAKSSWKDDSLDDIERPLNKRGRQTAAAMGRHLADAGMAPETILCSPAVRTRETLDSISTVLAEPVPTRFEQEIYDAEAGDLLARLRRLNDHLGSVMIIGHNPAMEDLTRLLVPGADQERVGEKFPTGSLAVIAVDAASWAAVEPDSGRLVDFVYGRALTGKADD